MHLVSLLTMEAQVMVLHLISALDYIAFTGGGWGGSAGQPSPNAVAHASINTDLFSAPPVMTEPFAPVKPSLLLRLA
jgi:hypothetical protein